MKASTKNSIAVEPSYHVMQTEPAAVSSAGLHQSTQDSHHKPIASYQTFFEGIKGGAISAKGRNNSKQRTRKKSSDIRSLEGGTLDARTSGHA